MSRRRGAPLLAALAIIVLSAAGYWLLRGRTPTSQPGLTLLVNHRADVELTPGTPLTLEASLTSSRSSSGFSVGSRWRPWHVMLRLEDADKGTAVPWRITAVGAPRVTSVRTGPEGPRAVMGDAEAVASLDSGRSVYAVTYAIDPDESSRIAPGIYRLRAAIETPFWLRWGWTGRVVSGTVSVAVVDPAAASSRRNALESRRLSRRAAYFAAAGRFPEGHREATALVALEPRAAGSYMLLGDTLAGLGRAQEALGAYRRALALTPRTYEEPRALMARIDRLLNPRAVNPTAPRKEP